jgi:hypothetical protein
MMFMCKEAAIKNGMGPVSLWVLDKQEPRWVLSIDMKSLSISMVVR